MRTVTCHGYLASLTSTPLCRVSLALDSVSLSLLTSRKSMALHQVLLVIGGVAAKDQLAALEQGIDIVVGTPGRLNDLISTGKLSLAQVRFLVLDECVWYHVCPNRGRGCYNTRLKEDGGCTIWYNEKELLSDIEEHLKCTITQCQPDIKVPVDDFDGKVSYGQRRALGGGNYKGHVDILALTVLELANLEREAQSL